MSHRLGLGGRRAKFGRTLGAFCPGRSRSHFVVTAVLVCALFGLVYVLRSPCLCLVCPLFALDSIALVLRRLLLVVCTVVAPWMHVLGACPDLLGAIPAWSSSRMLRYCDLALGIALAQGQANNIDPRCYATGSSSLFQGGLDSDDEGVRTVSLGIRGQRLPWVLPLFVGCVHFGGQQAEYFAFPPLCALRSGFGGVLPLPLVWQLWGEHDPVSPLGVRSWAA